MTPYCNAYMWASVVRKYMRVCLAYIFVERSQRTQEKKMDKYLGEKTHRAEKIASIRGKKLHVYRVIILKQMADHKKLPRICGPGGWG